MSPEPVLRGGCLCGGVRYEVDAPLGQARYCHCTRCQRRTGTAASASAVVPEGALRVVAGEELLQGWQPPDGAEKVFCRVCGSGIYSRSQDGTLGVRLGTVDGDPGVRPALRQYVANAAVWEPLPDDGLPRLPGPHA
ncbi:GFA family protein [Conexibacter sp. SYSU D00693]|uniref:GFA family protein n=1 Tax=Conexibacter sp. SYSU D00693 TaxID=2812560 RepID=UPI00196A3311|nr:GFA family protein [Conexibacter sp. SYSU D00693]